jgi:hypothetical protein
MRCKLSEKKRPHESGAMKSGEASKTSIQKMIVMGALIFSSLILFQSFVNSNDDERLRKKIIGTWSYSGTDEYEEDDIYIIESYDATITFGANGKYKDGGIMNTTWIDEEGYTINMKYKCVISGNYYIKNSTIIYECDLNNIKVELIQSDDYELSRIILEHLIPQLKHDMAVNNKEKINKLNERFLETKTDDGEITTRVRLFGN